MFGADSNQALRNSVRGYDPRAHLLKLLLVFNIACVIVYAVRTAKRIGGVTAKRKPVRLQPQIGVTIDYQARLSTFLCGLMKGSPEGCPYCR